MRKHRLGKQLLIVLCVILIVFLAGCRPSPVLEQIIYEQRHEIDEDVDTQTLDDDLENEEPDEDIPSRETVEDSEQETDQEHTAALAGDSDTDAEEPDAVYDVAYSQYGELSEPDETNPTEDSTSEKATGSTEAGGDEAGNAPTGEEGEESGTEGESAEAAQEGNGAGEEPTGGGSGDADESVPQQSGTGTEETNEPVPKHVLDDATGAHVEIPVDVNSVVAVGEAATIVEMLDNSGRLVGTSSSFTGSSMVQATFDLTGVNAWWEGDGSSYCNYFDALVAAHPDVCFEISGQDTFSADQITRLNDEGIAYFVLPQLNSIANIKTAATLVGQVLNDDYATSTASNYCAWADDMISLANGVNTRRYTTYIGRWDENGYWRIFSTAGELTNGYGLPVGVKSAGSNSPLDECMEAAHVTNLARDGYYIEPMRPNYWSPEIDGESAKYNSRYNGFYNNGTTIDLGTRNYPAVVVADSATLKNMQNAGDYFYYHWSIGERTIIDGIIAFGFHDLVGGDQLVLTYIEGSYDIFVNPSGVGSWANGSVESPLEAVWLSCVLQDDNISMDEMQEIVRNFYHDFYRTDNVNLAAIFPDGCHQG